MEELGAFGQTAAVCIQKMTLNLDGSVITKTTVERTELKNG